MYKKMMFLIILISVVLAGCVSPSENKTAKMNDTTPSGGFKAATGRDVSEIAISNIFGPEGSAWYSGNGSYHRTDDYWHFYTGTILDSNRRSHTFLVRMTDDYSVFRVDIDGICYLSKSDYVLDYTDWRYGRSGTKPSITDYPNYADAVNGIRTYDEIDAEFAEKHWNDVVIDEIHRNW